MVVKPIVQVLNLGRMRYAEALNIQKWAIKSHFAAARTNASNLIILVEHDPVYTIGIRTSKYPESEKERLRRLGADFLETNRGGLITFHGPGQLVAYPILNLTEFNNKSVRCYVHDLEECIIQVCSKYGLKGERSPDTGVWFGNDKVCAMGIHVQRRITSHGIALNCDIDLSWYDHIVPCGIVGKGVTSLSNHLEKRITIDQVVPNFLASVSDVFDCKLEHLDDESLNTLRTKLE